MRTSPDTSPCKVTSTGALSVLLCCLIFPAKAAEPSPSTATRAVPLVTTSTAGSKECSTTGANGAITLSNIVPRLNGVAPLAVFFDATGTTATATSRPFHDLEYRWDFGDRTGGVLNLSPPVTITNPAAIGTSTWNTGSRPGANSRNSATGPVAAHVYETPGTYTVTLTANDGTNSVTNNCTRITVQDPELVFSGANTYCIAGWNSPARTALSMLPTPGQGGCPPTAKAVVQPNFTTAINTYAKTGKRVLFRRGDTFVSTPYTPASGVTVGADITATGPGIVGAFGTGAAPLIQPANANGNGLLNISERTTPNIKDWRVMDLELDGMSTGSGSRIYSSGVGFGGGADQITLLRLNIHDTYFTGIGNASTALDGFNAYTYAGYHGHKMWDQIAVVDSSILRNHGDGTGNGGCGMYFAALRFSLLGTTVDDVTRAEHVLRFPYLDKAVISNNHLSRQAPNKVIIKLLAPTWNWPCGPGGTVQTCASPVGDANYVRGTSSVVYDPANGASGYTEHIVISDNWIENGPVAGWAVAVGPKNTASEERVRDVIAERNRFVGAAHSSSQTMFSVMDSVTETTARNNICDMSVATGPIACFTAGKNGVGSKGSPPDQYRIYNNTAYSSTTAGIRFLEMMSFEAHTVAAPTAPTNVTLQNNLVYAPSASSVTLVWTTCPGVWCPTQLNNSTVHQIKNVSPFAATPPVSLADYTPQAGYAIGTGASVPVWSDFFGTLRPQSGVPGTIDKGAIEAPN